MAKATRVRSGRALPATKADDTANPMTVPELPVPSISGDANDILAMAMAKLRQRELDAWEYFAAVADKHEVREAWLGLAVAHHFRNDAKLAGHALARAF